MPKSRDDACRSRSDSCTCLYKNESQRQTLSETLPLMSIVSRLYDERFIPLREKVLLEKLIRTRAEYHNLRNLLLSDTCLNEDLKSKNLNKRDVPARPVTVSTLLKLVNLVDKNELGYHDCCNCHEKQTNAQAAQISAAACQTREVSVGNESQPSVRARCLTTRSRSVRYGLSVPSTAILTRKTASQVQLKTKPKKNIKIIRTAKTPVKKYFRKIKSSKTYIEQTRNNNLNIKNNMSGEMKCETIQEKDDSPKSSEVGMQISQTGVKEKLEPTVNKSIDLISRIESLCKEGRTESPTKYVIPLKKEIHRPNTGSKIKAKIISPIKSIVDLTLRNTKLNARTKCDLRKSPIPLNQSKTHVAQNIETLAPELVGKLTKYTEMDKPTIKYFRHTKNVHNSDLKYAPGSGNIVRENTSSPQRQHFGSTKEPNAKFQNTMESDAKKLAREKMSLVSDSMENLIKRMKDKSKMSDDNKRQSNKKRKETNQRLYLKSVTDQTNQNPEHVNYGTVRIKKPNYPESGFSRIKHNMKGWEGIVLRRHDIMRRRKEMRERMHVNRQSSNRRVIDKLPDKINTRLKNTNVLNSFVNRGDTKFKVATYKSRDATKSESMPFHSMSSSRLFQFLFDDPSFEKSPVNSRLKHKENRSKLKQRVRIQQSFIYKPYKVKLKRRESRKAI